ncbi:hypothetical protein [Streptomyces canus]|uniref:hypothetical protein n=1 Tax=Streptomyces canus TaxID=58343 RepID=UPI002257C352|nr:hypothetical protein [Streptomyces canus]MCX4856599.1 hypothetical protein [Streptomyces canus]
MYALLFSIIAVVFSAVSCSHERNAELLGQQAERLGQQAEARARTAADFAFPSRVFVAEIDATPADLKKNSHPETIHPIFGDSPKLYRVLSITNYNTAPLRMALTVKVRLWNDSTGLWLDEYSDAVVSINIDPCTELHATPTVIIQDPRKGMPRPALEANAMASLRSALFSDNLGHYWAYEPELIPPQNGTGSLATPSSSGSFYGTTFQRGPGAWREAKNDSDGKAVQSRLFQLKSLEPRYLSKRPLGDCTTPNG